MAANDIYTSAVVATTGLSQRSRRLAHSSVTQCYSRPAILRAETGQYVFVLLFSLFLSPPLSLWLCLSCGRTSFSFPTVSSSSLFLPPFLPFLLVSPLKPLGIVLIELLLHGVGSLSSSLPPAGGSHSRDRGTTRRREIGTPIGNKGYNSRARINRSVQLCVRACKTSPSFSCRSEVTLDDGIQNETGSRVDTKLGPRFSQEEGGR